jgi:hypothetical protein
VDWNKQNPIKAKVLWQAVKDLVDLGQYCDLPPVMDLTTLKCADDEFEQLLREVMFASLQEKKALLGLPADPQIVELVDKLLLVYPKTPLPLTP